MQPDLGGQFQDRTRPDALLEHAGGAVVGFGQRGTKCQGVRRRAVGIAGREIEFVTPFGKIEVEFEPTPKKQKKDEERRAKAAQKAAEAAEKAQRKLVEQRAKAERGGRGGSARANESGPASARGFGCFRLSGNCLLQPGDVDLHHFHHRVRGPLGLHPIRFSHHLAQNRRDDLPRNPIAILQPSALFRCSALQQRVPVAIDLGLIIAVHHERYRVVERVERAGLDLIFFFSY